MFFDISKKTRYAILALLELAIRSSRTPFNARKLALNNSLPVRFLEVILNELKQGGFVLSVRGKSGGYILARPAGEIAVAEVLNFFEARPSQPSDASDLAVSGHFSVDSLMRQANAAVSEIFEECTLETLVQREIEHRNTLETNYVI